MRLMGKRQIGELQLSELIITLLLSELAAGPIADADIPLLYSILPIILLLSLEVIVSFFVVKIPFLKKIFDGHPSFLIRNGRIDQKEMKKLRISMEELLCQLRLKDIYQPEDVDYLILEENGQFTAVLKGEKQTPSLEDLSLPANRSGFSHALIIDGRIEERNLLFLGKTKDWLIGRVKERNADLSEIFLFSVNDEGKETVIRKEKR